jgi:NAD(P)-dependent dehydrogenase (short-subunit alcohol dehydrogenase family)
MRELRGKVAVITGAASGIGRALAERCAAEGMKVVLADVENGALQQTAEAMRAAGAGVLAVPTDVSKAADVEALARATLDAHGAVHLLCNNAGVAAGGAAWECSLEDWAWVLGVNLWGVIHGIRSFVPHMLAQGAEGHIVNTASLAGLTSLPGTPAYTVSKHGVVALSESLVKELAMAGGTIGVSVLCPGFVRTNIADAARNRPAELGAPAVTDDTSPAAQMVRAAIAGGMPPEAVAEQVLAAVRENRFYILTHPETKPLVRERMEDILQERNPSFDAAAFMQNMQPS